MYVFMSETPKFQSAPAEGFGEFLLADSFATAFYHSFHLLRTSIPFRWRIYSPMRPRNALFEPIVAREGTNKKVTQNLIFKNAEDQIVECLSIYEVLPSQMAIYLKWKITMHVFRETQTILT